MFVLSSDFARLPYKLPNIEETTDEATAIASEFSVYMLEKEEYILKKLLGKAFYDEMVDQFALLTAWVTATNYVVDDERTYNRKLWRSLQVHTSSSSNLPAEGSAFWVEVTDNVLANLFFGADYVYAEKTYEWIGMAELLRPYIYQAWVRDTYDNHTGAGMVVASNENGVDISPAFRISNAFNKFSELAGGHYCIDNTLYGFLYVNEDDYAVEHEYTPQGFINSFGL